MKNTNEMYKVNLHILEPCNYRCKHCFAHFDSTKITSVEHWMNIVDNCMATGKVYEFNIAGGEPLMYKDLDKLIKHIKASGARCSIITNGSLMTSEWIRKNAAYFDTIGFSIDSFVPGTMVSMGRCDNKGRFLSAERFMSICNEIRDVNFDACVKVNTVVTATNKDEVPAEIIKRISPSINKWKLLRMSVFKTDCFDNSEYQISTEEYYRFVSSNLACLGKTLDNVYIDAGRVITESGINVVIENTLTNTYIMIDSSGYLVDNSSHSKYKQVIDCQKEDFKKGLEILNFNQELYFARYNTQLVC